MVRFEEVEIKRGGAGYLISDYLFNKDRSRGDKIYLKCIESKRHFCPARAVIRGQDATPNDDHHNHDVPDIIDYRFRSALKQAVKRPENATLSSPKIFENVRSQIVANIQDPVEREAAKGDLVKFETARGSMTHARSSTLPPNPANRSVLNFNEFQDQLQNADGSNFLVADSGVGDADQILIFSNNRNLEFLAGSEEWFMDGTFWVVPFMFFQLFTIHAFVFGQQFPMVYVLLPNKTRETYERMFHMLMRVLIDRGLYDPNNRNTLRLQKIISDFESGLISAVRNLYPFATHQGCYFHFAQAIYKKIKELGYTVRYKTDREFRVKCRMLIALGLVPIDMKQNYLNLIQQTYIGDHDFQRIIQQYFIPTWFNHFALAIWNWFQIVIRTNNNVESWHSRFNKIMAKPHQSIFPFLLILKQEHDNMQVKLTSRINGERLPRKNCIYKQANERIMRIQAEYPIRQANVLEDYIRPLAHSAPQPNIPGWNENDL